MVGDTEKLHLEQRSRWISGFHQHWSIALNRTEHLDSQRKDRRNTSYGYMRAVGCISNNIKRITQCVVPEFFSV